MVPPIVFRFETVLAVPLVDAWAAFSDTERTSRLGGNDMRFSLEKVNDRVVRRGELKHLGVTMRWTELPVQFEAPRHLLIVRRNDSGPVAEYNQELWLEDVLDGTRVWTEHRFYARHALIRPIAQVDLELSMRPGLARSFELVADALRRGVTVPDLPAPDLKRNAQTFLNNNISQVHEPVASRLASYLRESASPLQGRMRPLALAKQWHLPAREVTAGLLRAARAGILVPQWEMICPSCKLPSTKQEVLDLSQQTQHCESCDVRYDASLADGVALTFRPSPHVRADVGKIDCLSSPARMPHILTQVVVEPLAELTWQVDLLPGRYVVRGWPQLEPMTLTVRQDEARRSCTVMTGPRAITPPMLRLGPGRASLHVRNKLTQSMTLVLERALVEPDTLTIGRVLEWPDAAALIPPTVLQPGMEVRHWTGVALVVKVARGGQAAENAVAELLAPYARTLQKATGWVLATLESWQALGTLVPRLFGTNWLTAGVGHGSMLELVTASGQVAAGGLLQELVGLAHEAEPGHVRVLRDLPMPPTLSALLQVVDGTLEPKDGVSHRLPLPNARAPVGSGDTVDARFVLGPLLGKGGFGLVFAAEDLGTNAPVVVKLLRPELADDVAQVQRFFEEGRLASRLHGPHAVHIVDWGLADDGRLFVAMERLEGRELADIVADLGSLDPVRAVHLCVQALRGLAEAHAAGLIHRDIKPQNLFVLNEGTPQESLKVIDYGIAFDRTARLQPGDASVMGTPLYMAPEQVSGKPLDPRCDVYAMGLVLYRLVSGSLPFAGDTLMSILMARVLQPPESLTARCHQPLPTGLAEVVHAALATDPQGRPASAEAMETALLHVQATAGPPAEWSGTWARHRVGGHADVDAETIVEA